MKFKKFLKRKFIPFLCAFLVVPFLFVSVFAVRFESDNAILSDPYGKFIARFYANGLQQESGDVYEFEYMPSFSSGVGIFNFTQIIEDTIFNRRYPDEYGVRYISVRSPLAITKLEEGDHIDISFNLVNVPDAWTSPSGQPMYPEYASEFRYFQPTFGTVQLVGKINGVSHTWVYEASEWNGALRGLPPADYDVYPPDTDMAYIWDDARFEINLAVPMKNDANYPANTDELIYTIDYIELSFARDDVYYPNYGITLEEYQYTNDALIQFTNFKAEYDVKEANTNDILAQISNNQDKILQYLRVNGLPEFDYSDIDGALSADADVDELAGDAAAAQSNSIAKGLDYLNRSAWSSPLLFMKAVFNSFLFPATGSGGIFSVILSILIPLGLFASVVSVFAEITGFTSRIKKDVKNKLNKKKNKKG